MNANKLSVNIQPNLIANNTITTFEYVNNTLKLGNYSYTESVWSLPKEIFTIDTNDSRAIELINKGEYRYNRSARAPLTFNFLFADSASPGDYEISFILSYKNGSQWYQSEKTIPVHVNNWYEQGSYQLLLLFIGILSIIGHPNIRSVIKSKFNRYRFEGEY